MTKKQLFIFLAGAGGLYLLLTLIELPSSSVAPMPATESLNKSSIFSIPQRAPQFASSVPAESSVIAAVPLNVVIDTTTELADNSKISITHDGKEYSHGVTTVDINRRAMRRFLLPSSPDGIYTVSYSACAADKTCATGQFQFAIDHRQLSGYTDMRGHKDVTIELSHLQFVPMNLRVSLGTRITWHNSDNVSHYVNTDAYPRQTYYPPQNSPLLQKGDSYSLVLTSKGLYPYHCSLHPRMMTGTIVVE